jgi:hypothetical protein
MLGAVGAGKAGGVLSPMLGTTYARGDEIPMLGTVAGGLAGGVLIPMLGTVWGGGGTPWASAGRTVKSPLVASATSSAIRLVIPGLLSPVVGRRGRTLTEKTPLVVEVAGGTVTALKWFAIIAVAVGVFYWLENPQVRLWGPFA